MRRGRLIHPFQVVLARLDTLKTRSTDPDGTGDLTGGYDDVFRAPHVVEGSSGERVEVRKEDIIKVPAQVEDRQQEALRQLPSGDSPQSNMVLTMHFEDLERLGLVDDEGVAAIHKNDRLLEIREICTPNRLVQSYRNPPGLFVTQAVPAAHGFGGKRNLLLVTLEHRDTATAATT